MVDDRVSSNVSRNECGEGHFESMIECQYRMILGVEWRWKRSRPCVLRKAFPVNIDHDVGGYMD